MARLSKVLNKSDLRHLVETVLDPDGGFGDMVAEVFNGTNPGYPQIEEPPEEVLDSVMAWLGKSEVDTDED